MLIRGTKAYNLKYNEDLPEHTESGRMINGQCRGAVSRYRYGICRMSFNGCEVIAVHNALVYLGYPHKLSDIAFSMECFRMFFGFFGCNPYKIGKALAHFGVKSEKSRTIGNTGAFIVSFWTKIPFLSSIHTVFCVCKENEIESYNVYNNCVDSRICKSIQELIGRRKPIIVFKIKKK